MNILKTICSKFVHDIMKMVIHIIFSFFLKLIAGQQIRFSFQNQSDPSSGSGLNNSDSIQPAEDNIYKEEISKIAVESSRDQCKRRNFSEESYNSQISRDSAYTEYNCPSLESLEFNSSNASYIFPASKLKRSNATLRQNSKDSVFQSSIDKDGEDFSSGEDYFVAKKPSYTNEQWKNYMIENKNHCSIPKKKCSKTQYLKSGSICNRRFSDVGPTHKLSKKFCALQEHRHSADNIFTVKDTKQKNFSNDNSTQNSQNFSYALEDDIEKSPKLNLSNIQPLMELPINIKDFSSSCESGENTTSPNTPTKVIIKFSCILQAIFLYFYY